MTFALRYSSVFWGFFNIKNICEALRDLVPFVQFKKLKKHPWRSVTFGTRNNTPPGCFLRFLNCSDCTKSHNTSHINF